MSASGALSQRPAAYFDNSQPLAGQVHDNLYRRIVALELVPYQKLSEKRISDELGVSRAPVREALARLAEIRLVDIFPQRGTFVAPLRTEELEMSQFIREGLEIALLRRALADPDRSELAKRLHNETTLQEAFIAVGDQERFYTSDNDFHGLIARQARMPDILPEIERAKVHMNRFRRLMIDGIDDLDVIVGEHRAIADAIGAGNEDLAESLLLGHLRRIFVHLGAVSDRFPHYFEDLDRRARAAQGS